MRSIVLAFFNLVIAISVHATVKSYTKDAEGVNFVLDIGSMTIRVWQPDVIEVRYTMLPQLARRASLVVNNNNWASATDFTVAEQGNNIVITTRRLHITVDKM